jgi:hypothetical protein
LPTDPACNWRKEFVDRIQVDMFVEQTLQDIIRNEETQCARIILLADEYRTKALDMLTSIYNNSLEVKHSTMSLLLFFKQSTTNSHG